MILQRALLLLSTLVLSALPLAADDLPAWAPIGPDGGEVATLATSPALPGTVFAGLFGDVGIFRSIDRGRTWSAAASPPARSVLDFAISTDGTELYAATDAGLLRSTDGGATWPALPQPGASFTLVEVHPRRPRTVLAVHAGILYRSTDGGATLQSVEGPEGVLTLAFSSGPRPVAWAGGRNGLWKSADAGATWSQIDLGLGSRKNIVQSIALDPRNPRVLYAGLVQRRRVLLKSTDGGATWKLGQRGLPGLSGGAIQSVGDLAVDAADSSIVYAVVGADLFRSVDAGRTWTRAGRPPGLFLNDLETAGYGLLAGTTAGVFLSTDRGLTWQVRTRGMAATSISGLAFDSQDPPRLYAGSAFAGIFRTADRGRPWLRLGDPIEPFTWGRPLQIDPEDPQAIYAGSAGAVAKSTDGGRSWTSHPGLPCLSVLQLFLDPRETSRLYAAGAFYTGACGLSPGACTFYRSADAGETWQCVGGDHERVALPLGIDPFTSAVYAQLRDGHLVRSTDGGETWSRIFDNLSADSFAASPRVEGTLWAGDYGQVHRSRDGGETWQDFTAGLPTVPVVGLALDPVDPRTLYAATGWDGVFKSTDAGETWTPAGTWPADVPFQGGLLVDPADPSILYAGTDGHGVLRLDQGEN